jgi:hypothetical protein
MTAARADSSRSESSACARNVFLGGGHHPARSYPDLSASHLLSSKSSVFGAERQQGRTKPG